MCVHMQKTRLQIAQHILGQNPWASVTRSAWATARPSLALPGCNAACYPESNLIGHCQGILQTVANPLQVCLPLHTPLLDQFLSSRLKHITLCMLTRIFSARHDHSSSLALLYGCHVSSLIQLGLDSQASGIRCSPYKSSLMAVRSTLALAASHADICSGSRICWLSRPR